MHDWRALCAPANCTALPCRWRKIQKSTTLTQLKKQCIACNCWNSICINSRTFCPCRLIADSKKPRIVRTCPFSCPLLRSTAQFGSIAQIQGRWLFIKATYFFASLILLRLVRGLFSCFWLVLWRPRWLRSFVRDLPMKIFKWGKV